jgi:hypothetical protein
VSELDDLFATWIATKRSMLLGLAKQVDREVMTRRERGEPINEHDLAREEYIRRLKAAAEALGPPTVDPGEPLAAWEASTKEGYLHCRWCKVDIQDVDIGRRRHLGSKAHRDALALQSI